MAVEDYFSFGLNPWGQPSPEPGSDQWSYDPNFYPPFPPMQPEGTVDAYPAVRSSDESLRVQTSWVPPSTSTNSSRISTPLDVDYLDSSDSNPSSQVSSESKRKLCANDEPPSSKRPKSANYDVHTAQIRKTGACLSCQMKTNKHRCIPGPDATGACQACWKRGNALGPLICQKARFQDIKIVRPGPSRDFANTLRWLKDTKVPLDPQAAQWKKVTNLSVKRSRQTSPGYIELQLSQGHSSGTLNVRVQEFDPVDSDKTSYPWFDNDVEHVYHCPHYAVADRDHATDQVRQFIDSNLEQYINHLLPDTSDPSASFVRMVFQTALDQAHRSSLIDSTLRFWVAGRLIEDPWSIQGPETLGMKLDPLPTSPFSQRIPVTPIMDFQIDNIVIYDYLMGMLDRIRRAMKQKIMPIKKENWFEIHLATFVLLHHADLTMKHDVEFALRHNMSKRFSNRPLIENITTGANSLLSFHQHEKGHFPLSAPNWSDVLTSHSFDESEKGYLQEARRLIQQIHVPRLAGDDLFWTSQIYDSTWRPAIVEVY